MPHKCAVEKAYEAMPLHDKEVFAGLIKGHYTAGMIAQVVQTEYPTFQLDRAAIGHFRRKLKAGKASLEFD